MSFNVTQPQVVLSGTITRIEYETNGDRVLQVTFSHGVKREITIRADGSVYDWRGSQVYAPGVGNGRLTTLNDLRTTLDSDLSTAVGLGLIVSPLQ